MQMHFTYSYGEKEALKLGTVVRLFAILVREQVVSLLDGTEIECERERRLGWF